MALVRMLVSGWWTSGTMLGSSAGELARGGVRRLGARRDGLADERLELSVARAERVEHRARAVARRLERGRAARWRTGANCTSAAARAASGNPVGTRRVEESTRRRAFRRAPARTRARPSRRRVASRRERGRSRRDAAPPPTRAPAGSRDPRPAKHGVGHRRERPRRRSRSRRRMRASATRAICRGSGSLSSASASSVGASSARRARRARTPPRRAPRSPRRPRARSAATSATDDLSLAAPRPSTASARISGVPSLATRRRSGTALASPSCASPHTAATATASLAPASASALSFGKRRASNLGRSVGSRSAPHAIMARMRSAASSAAPVANAKSGSAAFLFCTYASTSIAMRCWPTSLGRRARRAAASPRARRSGRGQPGVLGVLADAVAHALHEPEGEAAVDLDEEPPVDGPLRVADGQRQEILLERLERALARG